ncbi:MAG TPA: hypothetical protein VI278_08440 [Nitrososphaeraceae archaeon]
MEKDESEEEEVIGVIIYAISSGIQPTVSNYQEQCQSFLGKIGQTLDSNTQQRCTQVNLGVSASFGGMIIGGALGLIGIILAISGAVSKGHNKQVIHR